MTEPSSWQERYEASLARERDAFHPVTWPKQVWLGLLLTTLARIVAAGFVFWVAASTNHSGVWLAASVYGLYVAAVAIGRARAWLRRNQPPPATIQTGQAGTHQ